MYPYVEVSLQYCPYSFLVSQPSYKRPAFRLVMHSPYALVSIADDVGAG